MTIVRRVQVTIIEEVDQIYQSQSTLETIGRMGEEIQEVAEEDFQEAAQGEMIMDLGEHR